MDVIPLNDLRRTYLLHADRLGRAAARVMGSGHWLNGPETAGFCRAFADSVGVRHCIGVANGTDALEIALRALWAERTGPEPVGGGEVVTVANAGGYATTACRLVGLAPVYADVEPGSQLVSIPSAVACLSERCVAIVATHLYGGLVDVPALRAAADAAGFPDVPILEDCAQAHGLAGESGRAGAFGRIATFSFYPTKNLGALGDGGAIVLDDDALASRVARLRQYGWSRKYEIGDAGGRNSRLDEIQAAFLAELLPDLPDANRRRCTILSAYRDAAPDGVEAVTSRHGTVAHLAVVRTPARDRLRAHLEASGVATDVHYPVLDPDQPGWAGMPGRIGPSGLDASRASVLQILTLPCFPTLSAAEQDRVCAALGSFRP